METFWAFLVLLIVIVLLFVVIPALLPAPPIRALMVHPVVATTDVPSKPSQAEVARAQLDMQFQETEAGEVGEDYPRKKIGVCPYSKPYSKDLPLADIPMCVIQKNEGGVVTQGMRLNVPTAPRACGSA